MTFAYFDHNASTPVHPDVFRAMEPYLKERFGNASCLYRLGVEAGYALEKSRMQVARLIGASPEEIIFTSGGTEADNLALKGVVLAAGKRHIVTSNIEHPAVLQTCGFLERYLDCRVAYLPVNGEGRVDPQEVEQAIANDTAIVSIMAANNEIGTLQPIQEIAAIARRCGTVFHTDAVQAAGKIPIDVNELGVDLLSLSGHKIYGPKGVGALYVRRGTPLVSQTQGGSHEDGRRAGTENVPGIVGMGKAAELARQKITQRAEHAERLIRRLWEQLFSLPFPLLRNSPAQGGLPGTLNISLPGIDARELVRAMDAEGFGIASGSACSSGKSAPSYVVKALGRSDAEALAAIRISLGESNREEEIDRFVETLLRVWERVRFISQGNLGLTFGNGQAVMPPSM